MTHRQVLGYAPRREREPPALSDRPAVQVCPRCGEENPERARFCLGCAAALEGSGGPRREVRKTVTVVFSDVTGSTTLGERLDPESLRRVMARYFDEMRAALERHGGTVEKFIGDAVMAVFGIPVLHEDDALRAVRAAAEMRERLVALNAELERDRGVTIATRTGVNTGEVVAGDGAGGQSFATGDAVNVAARLEQAAAPGEILIGDATYRLVRDAVDAEPVDAQALRGKSEPVAAYRLLEVRATGEAFQRRLDSPMVGRQRELQLMRLAFDRAVQERACHLVTILGSAGVGKSRLIAEAVREIGEEATFVSGRCLHYGEGITYWPVLEIVKRLTGIGEDDAPESIHGKIAGALDADSGATRVANVLAGLMGIGESSPASADETAWAVRKLLESVARRRPLVVQVDDIHWAEPTLLDLVEHLADWTRDAPILLVCVARNELLEHRPAWGGGKVNATTILLEPLSESDSSQLVENLLGHAEVDDQVRRRVSDAAEGNPLFVEQMLAMLIDAGALRRQNGSWITTAAAASVDIPPTIQALIAARLDRLSGAERAVVERASVEGKTFHRGAVAALTAEEQRSAVDPSLMQLVRKELVRPDRAQLSGEDAFRFRHLLIRDAAYHAAPKQLRAELHEGFADWLLAVAHDRLAEYEEFVGYHLEQAYRYRSELGPADDAAEALAHRAGHHLASAGHRAADRGDVPGAAALLRRAYDLLGTESTEKVEAGNELVRALIDTGSLVEADQLAAELAERAAKLGDAGMQAVVALSVLELDGMLRSEAQPGPDERKALYARLAGTLERSGNVVGALEARAQAAQDLFYLGRAGECAELLAPVVESARRLGRRSLENRMTARMCAALYYGPRPASEVLRVFDSVIERAGDNLQLAHGPIRQYGSVLAMLGRFDEARERMAVARELTFELGLRLWGDALAFFSGPIELLAGDWEAAERLFRDGYERLVALGERGFASTLATMLGHTLTRLDRLDEAEYYARIGLETTSIDDFASQWQGRTVQALVLARRGAFDDALTKVHEGLAFADRSDYLDLLGDSRMDLADVLQRAGRPADARAALSEALSFYQRKENLVMAARVRAQLAELEGSSR